MRISGLFGAAIALSVLTPIAPARAATISAGDLMYTDLYKWQGQYDTPTWREILANFDCTEALTFYLWNVPSPPSPIVIPATPVVDLMTATSPPPINVVGSSGGDGGPPIGPVYPIGTPGGEPTVGTTPVPEPSTWAMLLLGFVGLGYVGFRRENGQRYLMTADEVHNKPIRTPA